ncbi:MAG: histidine phosphatase family protein [Burkholderiaceae bacterium]|nr:histidine phosphatase family protein [Burkholderiaceae bacterium]
MQLYLIRHPQPLVDADVCYGSSDVDVVAASLASVTERLVAVLPQGLPMYTSPLRRCAGLAGQLAMHLNCPAPIGDKRLQELHFGAWEMRRWSDIPYAEVDAWAADTPNYCPGGGESLTQMAQRVLDFRADILAIGRDSIVVCHAGSIRLLLASQHRTDAAGVARWATERRLSPAWGQLQVIDL